MSACIQLGIWEDTPVQDTPASRPAVASFSRPQSAPLFGDDRRPDLDAWRLYRKAMWRRRTNHPDLPPIPFEDWLATARPGRPQERPPEIPAPLWYAYQRAFSKRPADAERPSFQDWLQVSEKWRRFGSLGGQAPREPSPAVRWRTVVPRRVLTKHPEIEVHWNKRLFNDPNLARSYRVHLQGIQKKEIA